MKKNLIQRIRTAWEVLIGRSTHPPSAAPAYEVNDKRPEEEVIVDLQKLFQESTREHFRLMDEFFRLALKRVMPEYLLDLYKDTKQKIPGVHMKIVEVFDLDKESCGRECELEYRGVLIGKMEIKTRRAKYGPSVTERTIWYLYEQEKAKTEA